MSHISAVLELRDRLGITDVRRGVEPIGREETAEVLTLLARLSKQITESPSPLPNAVELRLMLKRVLVVCHALDTSEDKRRGLLAQSFDVMYLIELQLAGTTS